MTKRRRDDWQIRQLREKIGREAARLLLSRAETDYRRAARRAARRFGARAALDELPSPHEVREHLRRLSETAEAEALRFDPAVRRLEALRLMRRLRAFEPLLAVDDPEPRLELRLFADDFERVTDVLRDLGLPHSVQPQRQEAGGRNYTPIAVHGDWPARLLVHPRSALGLPWPTADGAARAALSIASLEAELVADGDPADLDERLDGISMDGDRFELFRYWLDRLEGVRQDRRTHPEGDALHHSLQVFDLAFKERPYDEEFLTAALLHDVGKAVDAIEPAAASATALAGAITHRTRWLIENLPLVAPCLAGALKVDDRHALQASEDYEDLVLLHECNVKGRVPGLEVPSIDEALHRLQTIAAGGY